MGGNDGFWLLKPRSKGGLGKRQHFRAKTGNWS